eukprot:jgi/Tetstr1/448847/TSEL_036073.t1
MAERGMAIAGDDAFWEGDDEEREPTGFLSSLNGSDEDETGERRDMRERRNGNRAFKKGSGGEPEHGTEDDKRYEDLPDFFPRVVGCGQHVYPPLCEMALFEEEYSFSTPDGGWKMHESDEHGVAICPNCNTPRFVLIRKNRVIILEPDGIYYDFGVAEVFRRMLRRPESAADQPYRENLSKNAFLNFDFGRALMEATDGAIGDPANLIMDVGIDGIQPTKFKHHSATVYVTRVANVPRHCAAGATNSEILLVLGEFEASRLGRIIMETNRAIDNRRGAGAANPKRFAKISQEKARGCTAREVEMFLERGVRFFRKIIIGKCDKDPERAFAVEMRLKVFELLFNDLLVSMRRDRGSVGGSAAAKNRHAHQDAVGRAISAKVVEEAFCEEGVNVHGHNAALFKMYVDEYPRDGLQVQHMRADTANIK